MKYGCIGNPLSHSFSAYIHEKIGGYEYRLCPLLPSELEDFMLRRDFLGINVTIPYKRAVIPYLDKIDDAAKNIGAVNTIVNRDGKLFGYNTDFYGMRKAVIYAGMDLSGKKTLILGTGGTSRTAVAVADDLGASEVIRVSRSGRENAVTYEEAYALHKDARVVINTSPAGMYPNIDDAPIDVSRFQNADAVFDAVFNPLRTKLVIEAKENGIRADAGLYMLVCQGVRASEIFFGKKYREGLANDIFEKLRAERENIVLIGMASSGKSTVGKLLSERLGRKFYDTDKLITERLGMSVPEIFDSLGEERFRQAEREVVCDISKENGVVIATGGGTSLFSENVVRLKQNGRLFLLDRSLEKLTPTFDRPLARDAEAMKKRYYERYDVYRAAADETVNGDGTVAEVANDIERRLKL